MIFGRNKDNNSPNPKQSTMVGQALRYSHMPGIIPRIRELGKKFGHFAYMLALIYRAVNLLPANHPYLSAVNIGSFGLRDVIAAAANNVKLKRENIDQVVVFGAVLMSVVLIALQSVVVILSVFMGSANASSGVFETPDPTNDVVFRFLTQVFGPDIGVFLSSGQSAIIGTPVHDGLYAMLAFYSTAMMTLAVLIIIYYIVTVVGEAAVSGTPFGRRFNSLWAPIRLVVALGLLVPLANGLNSGQYITLYIAKMGSGLATNAWNTFTNEFVEPQNVFVQANAGNVASIVQAVFTAEVCRAVIARVNPDRVVTPRVIYGSTSMLIGADPRTILDAARASTPRIDNIRYSWTLDDTMPYDPHCSGVNKSIQPLQYRDSTGALRTLDFSDEIHLAYMQAIKDAQSSLSSVAQTLVNSSVEFGANGELPEANLTTIVGQLNTVYGNIQSTVNTAIQTANNTLVDTNVVDNSIVLAEIQSGGWGKAGLWYSTIGKINSRYSQVAGSLPTLDMPSDPDTADARYDPSTFMGGIRSALARFWASIWGNTTEETLLQELDVALSRANDVTSRFLFTSSGIQNDLNPESDWFVVRTMEGLATWALGLQALKDYQTTGGATLDPMVAMMQVGDAQVTRAINIIYIMVGAKIGGQLAVLAGALISGPGGGIALAIGETILQLANHAAPILYMLILIGLGAGMMLFYLLPIIPFIYFMFAIVAWVMEIFEAVVAMPLWAISHLKIEGDGLPGQLAMNGYFLLLGILLRPILIVFGLIAGYMTFGAAAYYFHTTFGTIVDIMRQGDNPGFAGSLIYSILYVYISYSLATTCFKMIDNLPKGILRWIGQGGATPFSDERPEDPVQGSKQMVLAAAGVLALHRPGQNMLSGGAGAKAAGEKGNKAIKSMMSKGSGSIS